MLTFSLISKYKNCLSRVFRAHRQRILCKISLICVILFITIGAIYNGYLFFTREIEVVGWEVNKTRRALNYIHPDKDTSFTHVELNICSEKNPLTVIMVCSDVRKTGHRKAIRETWASEAEKFHTLVFFLLGKSEDEEINMRALEESVQFEDIIIEDVIDTYNNLTLKSIFMLKWVNKNCMNVPFMMKVDDDTYINLENLYHYLSQINRNDSSLQSFLVGKVEYESSPYRFYFSKWYVPRYMYPDEIYPNYIHGVVYVMSSQVIEKLYNQSLQGEMIHLEDVFITGICAEQAHIQPIDNELFYFQSSLRSIRCDSIHTRLIALSHYVDVYHMHSLHQQLDKCSKRS